MSDKSGPVIPPNDIPKRQWHQTDLELFQEYGQGLTKRELFAAMALIGNIHDPNESFASTAMWCVAMADALLKELDKK